MLRSKVLRALSRLQRMANANDEWEYVALPTEPEMFASPECMRRIRINLDNVPEGAWMPQGEQSVLRLGYTNLTGSPWCWVSAVTDYCPDLVLALMDVLKTRIGVATIIHINPTTVNGTDHLTSHTCVSNGLNT